MNEKGLPGLAEAVFDYLSSHDIRVDLQNRILEFGKEFYIKKENEDVRLMPGSPQKFIVDGSILGVFSRSELEDNVLWEIKRIDESSSLYENFNIKSLGIYELYDSNSSEYTGPFKFDEYERGVGQS